MSNNKSHKRSNRVSNKKTDNNNLPTSLRYFFQDISESVKGFRVPDFCFYRGVSDGNYDLAPSLFRNPHLIKEEYKGDGGKKIFSILENVSFYDFSSQGDALIKDKNDWHILYQMQHYGVPTRLLDWTESLGMALYFALNASNKINEPAIWLLDPYALNEIKEHPDCMPLDRDSLYNPAKDFKLSFYDCFVLQKKNYLKKIFDFPKALYPIRTNDRIRAQQGIFTLHGRKTEPLNKLITNKKTLRKVCIPPSLIDEIRLYLNWFGINPYTIYPDAEGLALKLKNTYYNKPESQ